jgi:modulator of FtsH protease HflK
VRRRPTSEFARLAEPALRLLDGAWQRMHWWIAVMAALYLCSGVTIVHPDEVAVILRWGRLVGATPALQEHGPGLLFAFPRPVDRVVRVRTKHVWDLPIAELDAKSSDPDSDSLDPLTQGYAITGDQNIVHVRMVAHYRVKDPAEWAFYGPRSSQAVRVEASAAMTRSLGEMGVDRVLSDGRKELVALATRRAQAGLDAAHSGLELTSIDLVRLAPPAALAADFNDVQSAFIGAKTDEKEARAYAADAVPRAQADADQEVQSARSDAASAQAAAEGDATAFLALEKQYRASPQVVRERLYRDAMDRALAAAGHVRWIPPPVGGGYHGMLISVPSSAGGSSGTLPPTDGGNPSGDALP